MEMTIRSLEEKDKNAFEAIHKESILQEFPEYSKRTLQYFNSPEYLEKMWSLPIRFGLFVHNELCGYLTSELPFGGVVNLVWLIVAKNHRGKGYGKILLQEADDYFKKKGIHALHLYADERNLPFYEKCGYEVYGCDDKAPFGSKDYLLRKVLQEPQEDAFFS